MLMFVQALALHLQAGFDLVTSWRQSLELLDGLLTKEERLALFLGAEESLSSRLRALGEGKDAHLAVWFGLLAELHSTGASLVPAVTAFAQALRGRERLQAEACARELPGRINLLVLLFFLPPALVLLFAPLLTELVASLPR